eukprot:CAMPEP_0170536982 /NCGR_PEP_ID=MMETSP0209-20121228/102454_1 /TAXON_ID=665100 ORGANISM="Litonotus pictus, Strain P1" /NCGR_SAMPLE_ID=MMETSP0209 /ASSEMBLY_ACC=CAM_ASM_000301 /LENGTH=3332 /DNA_ID=CAMNT_0010838417 /DNA_START=274 /DNA_END=10272 /DNA_ORIENTATION=-
MMTFNLILPNQVFESILNENSKKKCSICSDYIGALLDCEEDSCNCSTHLFCAQESKAHILDKDGDSSDFWQIDMKVLHNNSPPGSTGLSNSNNPYILNPDLLANQVVFNQKSNTLEDKPQTKKTTKKKENKNQNYLINEYFNIVPPSMTTSSNATLKEKDTQDQELLYVKQNYFLKNRGGKSVVLCINHRDQVKYCKCLMPFDKPEFMICCDNCEVWFHGRCVGIDENKPISTWICSYCLEWIKTRKNYTLKESTEEGTEELEKQALNREWSYNIVHDHIIYRVIDLIFMSTLYQNKAEVLIESNCTEEILERHIVTAYQLPIKLGTLVKSLITKKVKYNRENDSIKATLGEIGLGNFNYSLLAKTITNKRLTAKEKERESLIYNIYNEEFVESKIEFFQLACVKGLISFEKNTSIETESTVNKMETGTSERPREKDQETIINIDKSGYENIKAEYDFITEKLESQLEKTRISTDCIVKLRCILKVASWGITAFTILQNKDKPSLQEMKAHNNEFPKISISSYLNSTGQGNISAIAMETRNLFEKTLIDNNNIGDIKEPYLQNLLRGIINGGFILFFKNEYILVNKYIEDTMKWQKNTKELLSHHMKLKKGKSEESAVYNEEDIEILTGFDFGFYKRSFEECLSISNSKESIEEKREGLHEDKEEKAKNNSDSNIINTSLSNVSAVNKDCNNIVTNLFSTFPTPTTYTSSTIHDIKKAESVVKKDIEYKKIFFKRKQFIKNFEFKMKLADISKIIESGKELKVNLNKEISTMEECIKESLEWEESIKVLRERKSNSKQEYETQLLSTKNIVISNSLMYETANFLFLSELTEIKISYIRQLAIGLVKLSLLKTEEVSTNKRSNVQEFINKNIGENKNDQNVETGNIVSTTNSYISGLSQSTLTAVINYFFGHSLEETSLLLRKDLLLISDGRREEIKSEFLVIMEIVEHINSKLSSMFDSETNVSIINSVIKDLDNLRIFEGEVKKLKGKIGVITSLEKQLAGNNKDHKEHKEHKEGKEGKDNGKLTKEVLSDLENLAMTYNLQSSFGEIIKSKLSTINKVKLFVDKYLSGQIVEHKEITVNAKSLTIELDKNRLNTEEGHMLDKIVRVYSWFKTTVEAIEIKRTVTPVVNTNINTSSAVTIGSISSPTSESNTNEITNINNNNTTSASNKQNKVFPVVKFSVESSLSTEKTDCEIDDMLHLHIDFVKRLLSEINSIIKNSSTGLPMTNLLQGPALSLYEKLSILSWYKKAKRIKLIIDNNFAEKLGIEELNELYNTSTKDIKNEKTTNILKEIQAILTKYHEFSNIFNEVQDLILGGAEDLDYARAKFDEMKSLDIVNQVVLNEKTKQIELFEYLLSSLEKMRKVCNSGVQADEEKKEHNQCEGDNKEKPSKGNKFSVQEVQNLLLDFKANLNLYSNLEFNVSADTQTTSVTTRSKIQFTTSINEPSSPKSSNNNINVTIPSNISNTELSKSPKDTAAIPSTPQVLPKIKVKLDMKGFSLYNNFLEEYTKAEKWLKEYSQFILHKKNNTLPKIKFSHLQNLYASSSEVILDIESEKKTLFEEIEAVESCINMCENIINNVDLAGLNSKEYVENYNKKTNTSNIEASVNPISLEEEKNSLELYKELIISVLKQLKMFPELEEKPYLNTIEIFEWAHRVYSLLYHSYQSSSLNATNKLKETDDYIIVIKKLDLKSALKLLLETNHMRKEVKLSHIYKSLLKNQLKGKHVKEIVDLLKKEQKSITEEEFAKVLEFNEECLLVLKEETEYLKFLKVKKEELQEKAEILFTTKHTLSEFEVLLVELKKFPVSLKIIPSITYSINSTKDQQKDIRSLLDNRVKSNLLRSKLDSMMLEYTSCKISHNEGDLLVKLFQKSSDLMNMLEQDLLRNNSKLRATEKAENKDLTQDYIYFTEDDIISYQEKLDQIEIHENDKEKCFRLVLWAAKCNIFVFDRIKQEKSVNYRVLKGLISEGGDLNVSNLNYLRSVNEVIKPLKVKNLKTINLQPKTQTKTTPDTINKDRSSVIDDLIITAQDYTLVDNKLNEICRKSEDLIIDITNCNKKENLKELTDYSESCLLDLDEFISEQEAKITYGFVENSLPGAKTKIFHTQNLEPSSIKKIDNNMVNRKRDREREDVQDNTNREPGTTVNKSATGTELGQRNIGNDPINVNQEEGLKTKRQVNIKLEKDYHYDQVVLNRLKNKIQQPRNSSTENINIKEQDNHSVITINKSALNLGLNENESATKKKDKDQELSTSNKGNQEANQKEDLASKLKKMMKQSSKAVDLKEKNSAVTSQKALIKIEDSPPISQSVDSLRLKAKTEILELLNQNSVFIAYANRLATQKSQVLTKRPSHFSLHSEASSHVEVDKTETLLGFTSPKAEELESMVYQTDSTVSEKYHSLLSTMKEVLQNILSLKKVSELIVKEKLSLSKITKSLKSIDKLRKINEDFLTKKKSEGGNNNINIKPKPTNTRESIFDYLSPSENIESKDTIMNTESGDREKTEKQIEEKIAEEQRRNMEEMKKIKSEYNTEAEGRSPTHSLRTMSALSNARFSPVTHLNNLNNDLSGTSNANIIKGSSNSGSIEYGKERSAEKQRKASNIETSGVSPGVLLSPFSKYKVTPKSLTDNDEMKESDFDRKHSMSNKIKFVDLQKDLDDDGEDYNPYKILESFSTNYIQNKSSNDNLKGSGNSISNIRERSNSHYKAPRILPILFHPKKPFKESNKNTREEGEPRNPDSITQGTLLKTWKGTLVSQTGFCSLVMLSKSLAKAWSTVTQLPDKLVISAKAKLKEVILYVEKFLVQKTKPVLTGWFEITESKSVPNYLSLFNELHSGEKSGYIKLTNENKLYIIPYIGNLIENFKEKNQQNTSSNSISFFEKYSDVEYFNKGVMSELNINSSVLPESLRDTQESKEKKRYLLFYLIVNQRGVKDLISPEVLTQSLSNPIETASNIKDDNLSEITAEEEDDNNESILPSRTTETIEDLKQKTEGNISRRTWNENEDEREEQSFDQDKEVEEQSRNISDLKQIIERNDTKMLEEYYNRFKTLSKEQLIKELDSLDDETKTQLLILIEKYESRSQQASRNDQVLSQSQSQSYLGNNPHYGQQSTHDSSGNKQNPNLNAKHYNNHVPQGIPENRNLQQGFHSNNQFNATGTNNINPGSNIHSNTANLQNKNFQPVNYNMMYQNQMMNMMKLQQQGNMNTIGKVNTGGDNKSLVMPPESQNITQSQNQTSNIPGNMMGGTTNIPKNVTLNTPNQSMYNMPTQQFRGNTGPNMNNMNNMGNMNMGLPPNFKNLSPQQQQMYMMNMQKMMMYYSQMQQNQQGQNSQMGSTNPNQSNQK